MRTFGHLVKGDKVFVKIIENEQLISEEYVTCTFVQHLTKSFREPPMTVLIFEKDIENLKRNNLYIESNKSFYMTLGKDKYTIISVFKNDDI